MIWRQAKNICSTWKSSHHKSRSNQLLKSRNNQIQKKRSVQIRRNLKILFNQPRINQIFQISLSKTLTFGDGERGVTTSTWWLSNSSKINSKTNKAWKYHLSSCVKVATVSIPWFLCSKTAKSLHCLVGVFANQTKRSTSLTNPSPRLTSTKGSVVLVTIMQIT